jgi:hypothetical protein
LNVKCYCCYKVCLAYSCRRRRIEVVLSERVGAKAGFNVSEGSERGGTQKLGPPTKSIKNFLASLELRRIKDFSQLSIELS